LLNNIIDEYISLRIGIGWFETGQEGFGFQRSCGVNVDRRGVKNIGRTRRISRLVSVECVIYCCAYSIATDLDVKRICIKASVNGKLGVFHIVHHATRIRRARRRRTVVMGQQVCSNAIRNIFELLRISFEGIDLRGQPVVAMNGDAFAARRKFEVGM